MRTSLKNIPGLSMSALVSGLVFKASLPDAKVFRGLVDALSTIVSEASFSVAENSVGLRAMDPSRVAMVDLELPKGFFEEYTCDAAERISVSLEDVGKIMRRSSGGDQLDIETGKGRLRLRLKGKTTRTFSIPLLNLGGEELPTPKVPFKVQGRLMTDSLRESIRDAAVISDHIRFEASQDSLSLKASSDKGEVVVELSKEGGSLLTLEAQEPATALYSISYLEDMMKAADLADTVLVNFSTNVPIKLDFEMANAGRMTYFLAPRMENP